MQSKIPLINNKKLLKQALTHRSYLNEHPEQEGDNERLEFLGDAVLGFTIAELLYQNYPEMSEAHLTRLRSKLVDETQLTNFARELGLGKMILLGKGAEKDNGRESPSLLSDTFEAILGAYFLESGIEAVQNYIKPLFMPVAEKILTSVPEDRAQNLVDLKNRFQQWALAEIGKNPIYEIIAESGPDHAKEFTAQVKVNNKIYGTGKGRRKQEAQKQAAESALKSLGIL
ncbi:MAG: ribonuclease III [Prochloraceae cyanobacterium]|nr:ribonuclease III [Prochloraceae cyanobacterium]